jgi:hypothetical protein
MEHISKHLSLELTNQNNQELQQQEWQLQKTGDEVEALAYAVKGIKITNAPQEHLKEVLRLVMVKVGLRSQNWPQAEEKAVLLSHIIANYGGHTPQEILLAFDLAMLGQLPVDVNHFENFSCAYFSSIMNAYRGWAKENYRHAVKEPPPQIEHKEDVSDKAMQEWWDDVRVKVMGGVRFHFSFIPELLYTWMDKKGQIRLDNKAKIAYMDAAAEYLKGQGEQPIIDKVVNVAKKMIINDIMLKEDDSKR